MRERDDDAIILHAAALSPFPQEAVADFAMLFRAKTACSMRELQMPRHKQRLQA